MVQDWTGLDLGGIFMATFYIQLLELLVVRACKVCKARVCVDSAPSSCSVHSERTGTMALALALALALAAAHGGDWPSSSSTGILKGRTRIQEAASARLTFSCAPSAAAGLVCRWSAPRPLVKPSRR